MPYTCERCLQEFSKKDRYDSHLARKNPCKQVNGVKEIIEKKVQEEVRKVAGEQISLSENKEKTLQQFFEDLHNLLWNKAGFNPEKALEHMTFFFAYRLIEIQADNLNLPQECRWSFLANLTDENDMFEMMKKGCISFQKIPITKPFFKKPEIQKTDVIYDIVKLINKIPLKSLQETDALGDIFEYMLSRGMSTMADDGAYFTNRKICNLAFKLSYEIKKTVFRKDGSLSTFADWFCGTGGFPAEYVKGVKSLHKDIDWRIHSNSIYCQDMNMSSVTTTLLNMLILTGVPFSDSHIRSGNSFSDPINIGDSAPFKDTHIDYCFMNPPYGGDRTKSKEYKFAYSKGKGVDKKYLVNKEIQSIGVEDDDKVSAGVQLAMSTLSKDGGICAIVLPQGFFFGASKKAELRKKLSEEYKIWYVIDIPSGSFMNTPTKTSMFIFQRGAGPTENVKFIDLDEKVLVEASLSDLRGKNYSLNYKQYILQDEVDVEGFDMVKLKDIVKFSGGKFTTSYSKENPGTYPFFSGKAQQPDGNCKDYCFDGDEYIVMIKDGGSGVGNYNDNIGMGKVFYVNGKSAGTSHNIAIHKNNEKLNLKYLYYYLMTIRPTIMDLAKYTTGLGVISQSDIYEIKVPLPSLQYQSEIVTAIDGWNDLVKKEEEMLEILEKQVIFYVKEMGRGKEQVKLKDVCEFKRGKALAKKDFIEGSIPVIGGGTKPVGMHNISNRESYSILISQSGTAGHISRYIVPVWASDCFSLHANDRITNDYLYYTILNMKDTILSLKEGTAQPHIYPSSIENLHIQLPTVSEQETLNPHFDEIRHKYEKIVEYKAKAQEAIKRLIPGA